MTSHLSGPISIQEPYRWWQFLISVSWYVYDIINRKRNAEWHHLNKGTEEAPRVGNAYAGVARQQITSHTPMVTLIAANVEGSRFSGKKNLYCIPTLNNLYR